MTGAIPDERLGATCLPAADLEEERKREALWHELTCGPGDSPIPEERPDVTVGFAVSSSTVPFTATCDDAFGLIRLDTLDGS